MIGHGNKDLADKLRKELIEKVVTGKIRCKSMTRVGRITLC